MNLLNSANYDEYVAEHPPIPIGTLEQYKYYAGNERINKLNLYFGKLMLQIGQS